MINGSNSKKADLFKPFQITLLISLFIFSHFSNVFANGIAIENVELVDQDTTNGIVDIEFDISWNNAWKDSVNYDAAWVFAKYSTDSGSTWSHCTLKTAGSNPSDALDGTAQSGSSFQALDIIVSADKRGAFLQPAQTNFGTLDFHGAQLRWDYANDKVTDPDATTNRIKLFGLEMVYIPEEGFQIGDGSDGSAGEFEFGSASSLPAPISSEAGITFTDNAADAFYYNSDTADTDDVASGTQFQLSESFPKGFQAFYLMKTEMSQVQYRDFLNTLTVLQQNTRTADELHNNDAATHYIMVGIDSGSVTSRNGLYVSGNPGANTPYIVLNDVDDNGTGNQSTDGLHIAMNLLAWEDLCAYADWAALRPMTELEFEKAARGPLTPVDSENAWGTTGVTQATGAVQNGGQITEVANSTGDGLANFDGAGTDLAAQIRSGFAATVSTATRVAAGAGYYGNLDLSGNLWEQAVTVGNAGGRNFAGTHGDGLLMGTGNATNEDWPGFTSGNGVNAQTGSGLRGGAYNTADATLEISNRSSAADAGAAVNRNAAKGGRLARTASA